MSLPPFPAEYRASGILLHVTSLPSPHGAGDIGPAAAAWIDRLHEAGQRWWQVLPLGPTGYGDSPYQPSYAFHLPGMRILQFAFESLCDSTQASARSGVLATSRTEASMPAVSCPPSLPSLQVTP